MGQHSSNHQALGKSENSKSSQVAKTQGGMGKGKLQPYVQVSLDASKHGPGIFTLKGHRQRLEQTFALHAGSFIVADGQSNRKFFPCFQRCGPPSPAAGFRNQGKNCKPSEAQVAKVC